MSEILIRFPASFYCTRRQIQRRLLLQITSDANPDNKFPASDTKTEVYKDANRPKSTKLRRC